MYNWLKFFHPFHWLLIKRRLNFLHLLFHKIDCNRQLSSHSKRFLFPREDGCHLPGMGWVGFEPFFCPRRVPSWENARGERWPYLGTPTHAIQYHTMPYLGTPTYTIQCHTSAILWDTNPCHTLPYQCIAVACRGSLYTIPQHIIRLAILYYTSDIRG